MNNMTNADRLPASVNERPIRRPGWKLIQDVKPAVRPPAPTVHPMQPELPPRPMPRRIPQAASEQQPSGLSLDTTPARSWRGRLWRGIRTHALLIASPLIVIISIRLSAVPMLGEFVTIAYGVLAILRRIPSRVSFMLATIVLVGVGIEIVFISEAGRANTIAFFAFLLLCIGAISSMLETRRAGAYDAALRRR